MVNRIQCTHTHHPPECECRKEKIDQTDADSAL